MFIQRFQSLSERWPDRVAIRSRDGHLTYSELHREAACLADALRRRGVGPGQLVVVFMPRSPAVVTSLLATMLTGAAYTVIEVTDDSQEQANRLVQIEPDFVIAAPESASLAEGSRLPWCDWLTIEGQSGAASALAPVPPDAVAYVLYTSGSTGVPKGVAVGHDNLAHYCESLIKRLGLPDAMTYAHVSTLSADLGNTCLFLSLWTGGTLYLADEAERKDPAALMAALLQHRVNVLKITPTHWRTLLGAACAAGGQAPGLSWLILGGERLTVSLARATLASGVAQRLVNHYGPTETTIGVTVYPVAPETLDALDDDATIPIGLPFGRTTIRIRSADGHFGVAGLEGELYVGGPSVSRGYRNQPNATHERFVALGRDLHRYYRTGDLVRADEHGTLTFVGRADRQVKVNGYRVELEHVERLLLDIPGVDHAVVAHHRQDEHDYLLCAYEGVGQPTESLREVARARMPGHMVPVMFLHQALLPSNSNGKIDIQEIKRRLVDALLAKCASFAAPEPSAPADLRHVVTRLFEQCTGSPALSEHADFFDDLGADSLDAIQVISTLQLMGHPISAREFLACPTVAGLVAVIEGHRAESEPGEPIRETTMKRWPCSPAQQWFLERGFAEPDRWTQSMVLELGVRLDPLRLEQAFRRLLTEHAALRARFALDATTGRWFFEPASNPRSPLSVHLPQPGPRPSLTTRVAERYRKLEAELDIASGDNFRAELLVSDDAQYLLLVGHHLVVDVISWRILLDDLVRHYAVLSGDEPEVCAIRSSSFGHWCRHLETCQASLDADLGYWSHARERDANHDAGVERQAGTAWLTFTTDETEAFAQRAAACGTGVDRLLLACFFEQCAHISSEEAVCIDVESHGRLSLAPDIDVSRTVGWFTSTFPLAFAAAEITAGNLPGILHERLNRLPHLGHAYSRIRNARQDTPPPHCFNFLGQQRLGLRDDWKMRPARLEMPSLRGAENDRVYDMKLTGRIVDGQLVLDLNFNTGSPSGSQIIAFASALRRRIAPATTSVGVASLSATNTAGALWNLPADLLTTTNPRARPRCYETLFITGVTGFIGIHALRELLLRTDARIHCLIRDQGNASLADRLGDAWAAFFPLHELDPHLSRLSLVPGDVSRPRLGLRDDAWGHATRTVDAIYHFAADTRLLGSRADMQASILDPAREIIRLIETGRHKDLHYVSTLAVSGVCPGPRCCAFDEDALEVGQTFLNEYERAKFDAERLIRDLAYRTRGVFVYRVGNVTGHSRSGAFQRNAAANRWVQCLRAIAVAGQAPRAYADRIVLSPVDVVARSIVTLSLDPALTGGTFHVDADRAVPAELFVDAMEVLGVPIERVDHASLGEALRHSGRLDHTDVALGYFWAERGERNVRYDNRKTLALLARAGIAFPSLDAAWVTRFVAHLQQVGALPAPRHTRAESRLACVSSPSKQTEQENA